MQSNYSPLLERAFFRDESRALRWGTIAAFSAGIALFLSLFVIMVVMGAIFGQALAVVRVVFGAMR